MLGKSGAAAKNCLQGWFLRALFKKATSCLGTKWISPVRLLVPHYLFPKIFTSEDAKIRSNYGGSKWAEDSKWECLKHCKGKAVPLKAGPLSVTRCGKDHILWRSLVWSVWRNHLSAFILLCVTTPYLEISISRCKTYTHYRLTACFQPPTTGT